MPSEHERYPLDQALSEAEVMKTKLESGEAESYEDASQHVDTEKNTMALEGEPQPSESVTTPEAGAESTQAEYFRRVSDLLDRLEESGFDESVQALSSEIADLLTKHTGAKNIKMAEFLPFLWDTYEQFVKANENGEEKTSFKNQLEKVIESIDLIMEECETIKQIGAEDKAERLFKTDYYHNFSQFLATQGSVKYMINARIRSGMSAYSTFQRSNDKDVKSLFHSLRDFCDGLNELQKYVQYSTAMVGKLRNDLDNRDQIIASYERGETHADFRGPG